MPPVNLGRIVMLPKGDWTEGTSYVRLDVVTHNGSSFVCKTPCSGQSPSSLSSDGSIVVNTTYWQLLSARGEKLTYEDLTTEEKTALAKDALEKAKEAALYAQSVKEALEAAIGGDDPAASTVAQVAKNTSDIGEIALKITDIESVVLGGSSDKDPVMVAEKEARIRWSTADSVFGYWYRGAGTYKTQIFDVSGLSGKSISWSGGAADNQNWIRWAFVNDWESIPSTNDDGVIYNSVVLEQANSGSVDQTNKIVPSTSSKTIYLLVTTLVANNVTVVLDDKQQSEGIIKQIKDNADGIAVLDKNKADKTELKPLADSVASVVEKIEGSSQQPPQLVTTIGYRLAYNTTSQYLGIFYIADNDCQIFDCSGYGGKHVSFNSSKTGNNSYINYCFVKDWQQVKTATSSSDIETNKAQYNASFANVLIGEISTTQRVNGAKIYEEIEIPNGYEHIYLLVGVAKGADAGLTLDDADKTLGIEDRVAELEQRNNGDDASDASFDGILPLREIVKSSANYWNAYSHTTAVSYNSGRYLDAVATRLNGKKGFVFVTDTHWGPAGTKYDETSARKSNLLIDYLRKKIGIHAVVFGGDCFNQGDNTYDAAVQLSEYTDEFFGTFGKDAIYCIGNHDGNSSWVKATGNDSDAALEPYVLKDDEVYKRTIAQSKGVVYDTDLIDAYRTLASSGELALTQRQLELVINWCKLHFYKDDEASKTRFFIVDTGGTTWADFRILNFPNLSSPMLLHIPFLDRALRTLPEGYNFVVVGHNVFNVAVQGGCATQTLTYGRIMGARRMKSSYKLTLSEGNDMEFKPLTLLLGGTSTTLNYAKLPDTGKLIIIGGHTHADIAYVVQSRDVDGTMHGYKQSNGTGASPYSDARTRLADEILVVATNADSYRMSSKQSDADSIKVLGKHPHATFPQAMDKDTTTEHLFDIVTFEDDKVVFNRVGAGEDRVFNY